MASQPHFSPELFEFLRELEANNNRRWFEANRARYRQVVQEPLLAFIADFSEPLRRISRHFVADPRPQGGSMFRVHRDVRFSADKRPYKTMAAAQFRHRQGQDVHAPGFYLHLEPGSVFAGGGLWHPDPATLAKVRNAIVESPDRWRSATSDPTFTRRHTLDGDSLRRPPRGFDPDHPLIEDIQRKDFVTLVAFPDRSVCRGGFLDEFAAVCREAVPFMRFLTEAVGLEF